MYTGVVGEGLIGHPIEGGTVQAENDHASGDDGASTVEGIHWFGPERPISGTMNVLDSDGEGSDRDR